MTWNYRLVKHVERKPYCVWYSVNEVFYNDAGKPWAMTQDPITLEGKSLKEIMADLKLIQRDLARQSIFTPPKRWAKSRSMRRQSDPDFPIGKLTRVRDVLPRPSELTIPEERFGEREILKRRKRHGAR